MSDNPITLDDLGTAIINAKNLVTQTDILNIIPNQTSNSGKFLTTDGSTLNWDNVSILPDITLNSGKFLTTDGSILNWANTLPDQASNSGKFLTTDGTTSSWSAVLPSQTSNEGKFLKTDGTNLSWEIATIPPTKIDPNDLADDTARDKITYGDRRYNWFFEDEFFAWYMDRNITKIFNGVRSGSSSDSGSTPGDNYAPYIIKDGGYFTIYPTNGIYYKFRGLYWIDKHLSRLPSPGVLYMGDARFAAFGHKNNKWHWLGTCSMNNTDVDTNNDTDSTIPTVSITEEGSGFSYGNSGGYPKKWEWTHNIDFYEKYRIKHIKLGAISTNNETSFQNCDNMHEIEFF